MVAHTANPVLGKLRQKNTEFEASLGYKARSCLKTKQKQNKQKNPSLINSDYLQGLMCKALLCNKLSRNTTNGKDLQNKHPRTYGACQGPGSAVCNTVSQIPARPAGD
jgi:hypothetical protein